MALWRWWSAASRFGLSICPTLTASRARKRNATLPSFTNKTLPSGKGKKMHTPRITRPMSEDGTPKTYPQRVAERRAGDAQRRRDERERKAQAARDAMLAPPPPKPPTMEQRKAARAAEAEGKRLAEARAAEREAELAKDAG